eukprot:2163275-Pyramimonas_sp.AAC.1
MVVFISLLPKSTDDDRAKGVASLLVRLWGGIGSPLDREWCAQAAGHWDGVIAGSPSLRVVLIR